MLWLLIWLCFLLIPGGAKAKGLHAQLILSWNLRPYWEFAEAFEETKLFKVRVDLLPEDPLPWPKADVLVPVGHRAYTFLLEKGQKPLWVALVLHPSLLPRLTKSQSLTVLGGLYLRLPPEAVFPLLQEKLAPLLGKREIVFGIPFSSSSNLSFIKESQSLGQIWGFKVVALPLSEGLSAYQDKLRLVDVLYFLPDPFLESEEVISRLIKMAVLSQKIVVGYNRFFLKKGALLALVIDYRAAGYKAARLLLGCLQGQKCGWEYAPFVLLWNEKAHHYYQKREKPPPTQKPSSRLPAGWRKEK